MAAPTTYCVLPAGTDPEVVAAVRRHFEHDESVQVVVDRRAGELAGAPLPPGANRRRPILRRPIEDAPLEIDVEGARFEHPLPPIDGSMADEPMDTVIEGARANDLVAAGELRWRLRALVAARLEHRLGSEQRASRRLAPTLDALHDALPEYDGEDEFVDWVIELVDSVEVNR
ncbi:MAG TPA: hypothetical protein VM266_07865 [Solirubrobacteraceae bacterium]|nr:hypothetical protein [Solirubrobacteraceae bacterium]